MGGRAAGALVDRHRPFERIGVAILCQVSAPRQLFERFGDSPWAVYRFLVQSHPELDGETGRDALRKGRTADVIEAAESVAETFA